MVAAVAATLMAQNPATAQRISSPYQFIEQKMDLGVFGAYIFSDPGSVNLGPQPGPMAGVQYGLTLTGPIQLNPYIAYWPTTREIIDPSTESGWQSIGSTDLPIIMLGLRMKLGLTGQRTWHRLTPQIIAGVGLAFDTSQEPNCVLDRETPQCQLTPEERYRFGNTFMIQVGFGTAWMWSERLGARFSIEDYLWRITSPSAFRDPANNLDPAPPEKQWTNNFELSVGISYWF